MPHLDRGIVVAGLGIVVDPPLAAGQGEDARLRPFLVRDRTDCEKVVTVRRKRGCPPVPPASLVYDPGGVWRLYRDGSTLHAHIRYPNGRRGASAVMEIDPGWDSVTLREDGDGSGGESLLALGAGELLVRVNIIYIGGLVFHAVAVDDHGRGIVLAGHSGAGKSTQARLWGAEPGVVVLNDDRIALRLCAGRAIVSGLPWGGDAEIARNHEATAAAIVVLEQAAENEVVRLDPAVAAPLLAARAFMPYWDAGLVQRALGNLDALLRVVPAYVLRCRPTRDVIDLLRARL